MQENYQTRLDNSRAVKILNLNHEGRQADFWKSLAGFI